MAALTLFRTVFKVQRLIG